MINSLLIALIQNVNIDEKINQAPDNQYAIGVLIGSFLPVICLGLIAYGIYYYNKTKK